MRNLFNLDNPFWQFLTRLADLVILNLLWLVFCLPVFTIGASTTALYRSLLTLLDDGASSTVKLFWQSFRSNFKKATILFLILLVPFVAVSLEVWAGLFAQTLPSFLRFVCLFAGLLFGLAINYVYPLTAQFENTIGGTIKNAVIIAIVNLPRSILILLLSLIPVIVFLFFPQFLLRTLILWIAIGFALIAYCNTVLFRAVFRKYIPDEDEGKEVAEPAEG